MAQDMITQFYACLNLPLQEKLIELARIIEQCSSNKDLQNIFAELINSIFSSTYSNGWGLRTVTSDINTYEFESLMKFLEPQGPIFRLCYKLLSDPQLKYNLPLSDLPRHLQITLERGRYSQFYADLLSTDSQTMNVVNLALNPFDYYMFHFALDLISNNQYQSTWENRNSVYFSLACDYLMHFLPSDPNAPILPTINNYTGKMPMAAPLQTANRPLYSPSLLLRSGLTGSGISNQHTSQAQSRNEIWRSETVLQVFVDIWMGVEQFNVRNMELYQRNKPINYSSPERVRIVRVLVKHLHSFSAKHVTDPTVRSSSLRRYAQQIMCMGAYHYIKHLVMTWPLDSSFRLVMELWLSLIQPWRYIDNTATHDRYVSNNNHEEGNTNLDSSFIQFIAENFPSYTCILQLVLPRFMRLDLTAYKNAIMLFRLGKVYSQQHLVPILCNLEQAIIDSGSILPHNTDTSFNNSTLEQSYTYNGVALHKWVAVAKQAITELNMSSHFEYEPIWSGNMKSSLLELLKKIIHAKAIAQKQADDFNTKFNTQNQGIWGFIKHWFMMGNQYEDEMLLQEYKKVPSYLNASITFFTNIFGLNEDILIPREPFIEDSLLEQSSIANSTSFPLSITNKLRSKNTQIHYMGDSDLMPITSYESTILVRMLHQIASRTNELFGQQFSNLWNRRDFCGYLAREILQTPCTIQKYVKDATNHQTVVYEELPARLSLRRLGSHAFVFWITVGYFLFKLFSLSGPFFLFVLFSLWLIYVFTKASLKMMNVI